MTGGAAVTAHTRFCIAASHPALPGHFPGAPVVPGVLLLAAGLQQLETHCGRSFQCRRIVRAKFLQPVAPGDPISASLKLDVTGLASLDLHVGDLLVAQATLVFLPPTPEAARA